MENNHESPAQKAFLDRYLTPIAVVLAGILIAFALVYGKGMERPTPQTGQEPTPAVDIAKVQFEGEPYIGDPNAPTTVAVYYDYQCPFCKQFEQTVTPELIKNYVQTGKTKIIFKDFQFLGKDSIDTAVYARAVWEAHPDRFYDWYVATMTAQDDEGDAGFGDLTSVRTLTATIPGINAATVDALIAKNRTVYEAAINADRAEGASFGINGTPSVIVGKQLLSAMKPSDFYAAISKDLDAQLAKK